MEASGGMLLLSSLLTKEPGALLSVPAGAKLVTPVFPTSAGTISMAGGTLDTGGHPLANTGLIPGFGTLRGGTLTNDGSMVLHTRRCRPEFNIEFSPLPGHRQSHSV